MRKSILLLFAALLPLVASAEKVEIDGIWYNLNESAKQAEVTSSDGTGYSGSITIPATITHNGVEYSVTRIGSYAFYGRSSLTAITLPEGVTSIGYDAFYGCSGLTAITLPEGVTSIGGSAFANCSSLTSITFPESVTYIEHEAFKGTAWYENHPDGMIYVGKVLYKYKGIIPENTLAEVREGTVSISGYAFSYCSSLTSIKLPEGITEIGLYAFIGCRKLTSITFPSSITSIGGGAFQNTGITSIICYAKAPPSCGTDAFFGLSKETVVYVPNGSEWRYRTPAGWKNFTKYQPIVSVNAITLSQTAVDLIVGESAVVTAKVSPEDAFNSSIIWNSNDDSVATVDDTGKVTAIAPGTACITATANDGSGVSASCEVTVKEKLLGKCATPTISYKDGKVVFACDTERAIVKSNFIENIAGSYNDMKVAFIPTYTLTAYATKEKYEDSDVATLTLCWVPCDEKHESEETGILTIPSHPVLISTQGGTITLSGLAEGTAVAAYSTASTELATATATNGTATLTTGLEAGSIAIVKIGDYSIKVAIK